MSLGMFHSSFIYKNKKKTGFGLWAIVCTPLSRSMYVWKYPKLNSITDILCKRFEGPFIKNSIFVLFHFIKGQGNVGS